MAVASPSLCCVCSQPIPAGRVDRVELIIPLTRGGTQRLCGHVRCLQDVDSVAALVGPESSRRWRQVHDRELDYPGRDDRYYFDGVPFTGVSCSYYPGEELECVSEWRQGKPWGWFRRYSRAGGLLEKGVRRAGFGEGIWRTWHPNERLASEELREFSVALWRKRWSRDSTLVEDYALPQDESNGQYQTLQMCRSLYGRSGYIGLNRESPASAAGGGEPGAAADGAHE